MIREYQAKQLADTLIKEHKLVNWQIQFNKSTKHLGECWHQSKVIAISIHTLQSCSAAEFHDTMLHEIAHALVGPNNGHNEIWKAKALEIGCTSNTCGNMSIDSSRSNKEPEKKEKKHVPPLTQKCPTCNTVAIEISRCSFSGNTWLKLKCGHLVKKSSIKEVTIDNWISESGKELFPYQRDGINKIAQSNGRLLIADEPGLGKTVQGLGFLKFWPELSLPALVVCKTTLKLQWVKEALDWCGIQYMAQTIDSSRSFIMPNLKIYIISMDLLHRIDTEKLSQLGIKTIIADEIQHFKNPDSKRTQELRRLVNEVDFFIPLSGTPWKNRGSEYFPVLNMLDPTLFPSYNQFQNKWVDWYVDTRTGKYKQGGIRNIPAFKEATKHIVIRRMRDDVLPDLPKINRQIRYIELDTVYGESYEKAEARVAEIIKDAILEGRNMTTIASELMRLKHITGLAKVDVTADDIITFLDETDEWEKITIFHHHIDVGDRLQSLIDKWLVENGLSKSLRLLGGMDNIERDNIITKFKISSKHRILIASTLASGEGLNIQFCQNAIMMERQWNPANEEQAELRFSRPITKSDLPDYLQHLGDKTKVSIRVPYMICAGTVDEMLTEIIERKRLNFRKSMNDKDINLEWSENDVMKELSEMIVRKRYGKK